MCVPKAFVGCGAISLWDGGLVSACVLCLGFQCQLSLPAAAARQTMRSAALPGWLPGSFMNKQIITHGVGPVLPMG